MNKLLSFAFLSLFLIGCKSDPNVVYVGGNVNVPLPTAATNLKDEGNGWYSFDFGQNKLLMFERYGRCYSFQIGPSDKIQKELDEIGDIIEENIRKERARPFNRGNDIAPIPPTKDEESRSI